MRDLSNQKMESTMAEGITHSEKFVFNLCKNTFLSLWSYVNPIGKDGKELCDILVVCDPYILVFSVKDVLFDPSKKDPAVVKDRWIKRAITESDKQIDGAIRFLNGTDFLCTKSMDRVVLPPKERRVYIRIAVAFGSKRAIPLTLRRGQCCFPICSPFGVPFLHCRAG